MQTSEGVRVPVAPLAPRIGDSELLTGPGSVFLSLGDGFFGNFAALGLRRLDPWTHVPDTLPYGLVAGGAHRQLRLLRS
jgi:hypothetical protein